MTKKKERIVVLGGGFGGLLTAMKIARKDATKEVTIIDRRDEHVYTPWLYETVSGFLQSDKKSAEKTLNFACSINIKDALKKSGLKNVHFKKREVTGLHTAEKTVACSDGQSVEYDKVVISLGSVVSDYGIPGVRKYGMMVTTIEQGLATREAIMKAMEKKDRVKVIVVGGGAVGVETATELAHLAKVRGLNEKIEIMMIDGANSILARFPKILSRWATRSFEKLGISLMCNVILKEVKSGEMIIGPRPPREGEGAVKCDIKEDTTIAFDVLIWAGGMQPNPVIKDMELPKTERGKIRVLPTLQVEGHKDIFALGDAIFFEDPRHGLIAPDAAWVTVEQAPLVAHNLTSEDQKNFRLPKNFPAIVMTGGKKAAVSAFGVPINGYIGYLIRLGVDLNHFRKILPLKDAFHHWRRSIRVLSKNDS